MFSVPEGILLDNPPWMPNQNLHRGKNAQLASDDLLPISVNQ